MTTPDPGLLDEAAETTTHTEPADNPGVTGPAHQGHRVTSTAASHRCEGVAPAYAPLGNGICAASFAPSWID